MSAWAEEPIDRVVVNVSRREPSSGSASRLTARELAAVPRRTAEDALSLVPGFTLVQHGSEGKGHQFFVRGFDAVHGADLELRVDGIPINEWSNVHAQGYIDLGFVIPEVILAVDVTKGPFSIDQGAFAMAGSAEYHLGVPAADLGLRATYALGTTGRHRALVTYSPMGSTGSSFVALEALSDSGFGVQRGIERGALLGRVTLFESGYGALSALGAGYAARFDLPTALRSEDVQRGLIAFDGSYDDETEGASDRILAALKYELGEPEHGVEATLDAGYRRLALLENATGYLTDPIFGDRREQVQETWSYGVDVGAHTSWSEIVMVRAGLGARTDVFEQRQDHVAEDRTSLARERELEGSQTRFGARAGATLQPLSELTLSVGLRVDAAHMVARDGLAGGAQRKRTLAAVSPRLGVEVEPRSDWVLFGAYGRGFRPPEARALSSFAPVQNGIGAELYRGGEPAMTVTDSFELGSRWRGPSSVVGARLACFATFVEREAIYDHVSGTVLELNGTRRVGAELELDARPSPWLSLGADGSAVDARFVRSRQRVPLVPWLTAGARAVLGRELGPRAGVRFFTLAPRALPHGARGATLASLDASLGYHWSSVRIDAEIENLLDVQLREGEYHYASAWRGTDSASQLPVLHHVAGPPLNLRVSVSAVF